MIKCYDSFYCHSEGVELNSIQLSSVSPRNRKFLMTLRNEPFEKVVGKGENAGNQHFLLFSQRFLPHRIQILL